MKETKKIAAAIIGKDGKILIARRGKQDENFGKWEFPGGKVEPGETLEQCLKRELIEELGITADVGVWEVVGTKFFYTHRELRLMENRGLLGPLMEIIIFMSIMLVYMGIQRLCAY